MPSVPLEPPLLAADTVPGTAAWRRARSREIIRDHTLLAAGAGLIPLPWVDSVAVGAAQIAMLAKLSRLYGADFNEDLGRSLLSSFSLGFVHHVFTQHAGAGGRKLAGAALPIVGRALATVTWPAVFAFFTHRLGEACARHYEAGGKFSNFKAQALVNTPFAPLALHFINK